MWQRLRPWLHCGGWACMPRALGIYHQHSLTPLRQSPPAHPCQPQVVTRVSYLKTITTRHAPDALLPWTSHVACHGASHRGVRDMVVSGGAAGCLRPVAPFLVPLRMARWADTAPSARDIEAAIAAGEADAAAAAAAAVSPLLVGRPPPPPGLAELRRLGLGEAPLGGFELPPPHITLGSAAARTTAAAAAPGVSAARPLNAHCYSPEVRPGAGALARARARLAMPGTDVTAAEDAAQRDALRRALAVQQRGATRLPLWVVHGERGLVGAALGDVAEQMLMPVYALELADPAVRAVISGDGGGGDVVELPSTLQELAVRWGMRVRLRARTNAQAYQAPGTSSLQESSKACRILEPCGRRPCALQQTSNIHRLFPPPALFACRHMDALLALQPAGPHVLVGYGPFSCMLASAIACELEHHASAGGAGGAGGASLLLVDGAPVPPVGLPVPLPPPAAYALFALLLDVGALLPHAGLWRSFVEEFGASLAAEGGTPGGDGAPERALRALAGLAQPAGGATAARWDDAVERTAAGARLAARLLDSFESPEYVFQGRPAQRMALCHDARACRALGRTRHIAGLHPTRNHATLDPQGLLCSCCLARMRKQTPCWRRPATIALGHCRCCPKQPR